jgi:hypothetical protein
MLRPAQENGVLERLPFSSSVENTAGVLTDMLAPSFKHLLEERLTKLSEKDLPKLLSGEKWVFEFTQDFGSVYSLYVGIYTETIPRDSSVKLTRVIRPLKERHNLYYLVNEKFKVERRLDKKPFLAIRDSKGRNYATITAKSVIETLKKLPPQKPS